MVSSWSERQVAAHNLRGHGWELGWVRAFSFYFFCLLQFWPRWMPPALPHQGSRGMTSVETGWSAAG